MIEKSSIRSRCSGRSRYGTRSRYEGRDRRRRRTGILIVSAVLATALPGAGERLQLEAALYLAFDRSPTIQDARHNLEINHRNLQAQRAALKSRFGLTVTPYEFSKDRVFSDLASQYNTQKQTHMGARFTVQQPVERTDGTLSVVQSLDWRDASSSFAGTGSHQTYSNQLFLRYSQPLFTYNRTKHNLEALELALEGAQLRYAIERLQIESRVTSRFLDLYLKQRNVEIVAEELKNSTERFDLIRSKVDAGIAAREQLLQADITRANARGALQNGQLDYANALDDLKMQLGIPFEHDLSVSAQVGAVLVEVDLRRAIDHGLANRMELRQQDIAIRNAMRQLTTTEAENDFAGSVDVTFGLTGTDEDLGRIYADPSRNQRLTLSFNVPLYDWGEKRHRMAAAAESVARSELSANEERKRITAEIRQAHRNLETQKTQIEIAGKNVVNARQTYEINLERYRHGELSSKDIADYQNQLSREQINEVGALINYRLALLELKVRTLYDFVRDEAVRKIDFDPTNQEVP